MPQKCQWYVFLRRISKLCSWGFPRSWQSAPLKDRAWAPLWRFLSHIDMGMLLCTFHQWFRMVYACGPYHEGSTVVWCIHEASLVSLHSAHIVLVSSKNICTASQRSRISVRVYARRTWRDMEANSTYIPSPVLGCNGRCPAAYPESHHSTFVPRPFSRLHGVLVISQAYMAFT
jgi:hypothetical protein